MAFDKKTIRATLLSNRMTIGASERAQWERSICDHLFNVLKNKCLRRVSTYISIKGEVGLSTLYDAAVADAFRIDWALPVCGVDDRLVFAHWAPGDPLVAGRYGIDVPASVVPLEVQALLIPCVGFNAGGYRLGYGGGWFDRTLANYQAHDRPLKIGIAFACQAHEGWSPEPHDQPLDAIVTEHGIHWFTSD